MTTLRVYRRPGLTIWAFNTPRASAGPLCALPGCGRPVAPRCVAYCGPSCRQLANRRARRARLQGAAS